MKIIILFGTRPETIKCAPLILEGKRKGLEVKVVFTGQHKEMALPLLDFFKIEPDIHLNLMRKNQSLSELSALALTELEKYQELKDADAIVVQGDTTSAFIGGYWGFLNKIPVVHLEAGLRTYDLKAPFPEEGNRQLLSRIASLHLAPTSMAQTYLEQERVQGTIATIGNTGIDSLKIVIEELKKTQQSFIPSHIQNFLGEKKLCLITGHRRENFGDGFKNISQALTALAKSYPDIAFVYPVHLNPEVQKIVLPMLGNISNILLAPPVDYIPFIALMQRADIILTDSGGVQEEAPSLRKPVIVMREVTERPEGVEAGFAKLVGTDPQKIEEAFRQALKFGCQGKGENPYGDGKASERAIDIILKSLYKKEVNL